MKRLANITPLLAILLLTACGGQEYHQFQTRGPAAPPVTTVPTTPTTPTTPSSGFPWGGGGTGTGTGSTSTNTLPPVTSSFSVSGPGGINTTYTFSVNTDNVLKIDIAATPAGNLSLPGSQYSNFT